MTNAEENGSILVEVLVAFTILAMAVIMSFDVLGSGTRRVAEARQRANDMRLAQEAIGQLQLQSVSAGVRQGKVGDLDWVLEVIDLKPKAGLVPQRIIFRALRGATPGPEDVLLDTIILPRPVEP